MSKNDSQRTTGVWADESDDISDLHSEMLFLQYLVGFVRVGDDAAQDAEVAVVCNTHGRQIDTCSTKGISNLCQTTRLVLEKYG